MSGRVAENLVLECRKKLLIEKQEVLNRFRTAHSTLLFFERGGDEGDQSVTHIEEHSFLVAQSRLRNHLLEIEMALGRIEQGTYGICEETDEVIEADRLRAIPWTRLSIEGAELREAVSRKYAR